MLVVCLSCCRTHFCLIVFILVLGVACVQEAVLKSAPFIIAIIKLLDRVHIKMCVCPEVIAVCVYSVNLPHKVYPKYMAVVCTEIKSVKRFARDNERKKKQNRNRKTHRQTKHNKPNGLYMRQCVGPNRDNNRFFLLSLSRARASFPLAHAALTCYTQAHRLYIFAVRKPTFGVC